MQTSLVLLFMLLVILLAAEVFTNALEHLGSRLKISEGVTGSLFAAVGTALPETLVPVLALFAGTSDVHINEEIGVGAVLGAPLMLSTLSVFLMSLAVTKKRGAQGHLKPEHQGMVRDLNFFLFAYAVALAAMFLPLAARELRITLSIVLVLTYFVYILMTLQASKKLVQEGHATEADQPMLLARLGLPTNMVTILLQLALGLGLLIVGAKGFIAGVDSAAKSFGISALLLSLLIIPIATELPEKVNSILWVRRGKDTLAFGNITGAMVFQGTLLPAIGIMLTPWAPRVEVFACITITLLAASWMRYHTRRGGMPLWVLYVNGSMYLVYIALALLG